MNSFINLSSVSKACVEDSELHECIYFVIKNNSIGSKIS